MFPQLGISVGSLIFEYLDFEEASKLARTSDSLRKFSLASLSRERIESCDACDTSRLLKLFELCPKIKRILSPVSDPVMIEKAKVCVDFVFFCAHLFMNKVM